jgi:hypothetical protein
MDNSMPMNMMSGGMMWCAVLFVVLVVSSIIQTVVLIKILQHFKKR